MTVKRRSMSRPAGLALPWRTAVSGLVVLLAACAGGNSEVPPPKLTIASSTIGVASGPVTFTFAFDEDVGSSFTVDDVVVSAGSKGNFSNTSATQYTLVVTPPPNAAGSLSLSVAAQAFTNLSGVAGETSVSTTQDYNTQAPTLAIAMTMASNAAGKATGAVTVSFTFNKDVGSSFTADDVVVSAGSKGVFTRLSATQASLVIEPPANAEGAIRFDVAAGAFSDLAGKASSSLYFGVQQYDTR